MEEKVKDDWAEIQNHWETASVLTMLRRVIKSFTNGTDEKMKMETHLNTYNLGPFFG